MKVTSHRPSRSARTQTLLRQPSVSSQNDGVRECAELLSGWLAGEGATVELVGDDYPLILAEWDVAAAAPPRAARAARTRSGHDLPTGRALRSSTRCWRSPRGSRRRLSGA
jgi:hypothetical protein